jgi:transcriptional regulator with XRE-family HTH domain
MSQENVALDLGFSQRAYSKIERGETQVSIEVINKLAKLFDMKPEDILNFNPETFIQTNSTYNSQTGGNNHFTLECEHVKFLKSEIDFLKTQLKQKDDFIKELMKKLK